METIPRQAVVSACLALLLAVATGEARAQARRPSDETPTYLQGKPDQAEGRKILEEFRQTGWSLAGAYYLEFELRVLPRRGDERVVPGRLWGRRNDRGPITRVELQPGVKNAELRLLVQVGTQSAAWRWPGQAGGVASIDTAALFEPLAGTDFTVFDLQMPFLYWSDFSYEGIASVTDRPAHVFLLRPPPTVTALKPELKGVRVWLDTQFNALRKAEELGRNGQPLKSITGGDLKKIGEQWIAKWVEVRDETTRNKTQFAVTGAALGQEFSAVLFDPVRLTDAVVPPPADRVQRVGP